LQLKLFGAVSRSSILWSPSPCVGGNAFASSLEKRASCHLNFSGSLTFSLTCPWSYLWAISMALCMRLISTGPPNISTGVTPDHGWHSTLAAVICALSFCT